MPTHPPPASPLPARARSQGLPVSRTAPGSSQQFAEVAGIGPSAPRSTSLRVSSHDPRLKWALCLASFCLLLLSSLPAHAHCVFNYSSKDVTVVRLPFNITTSFKAVVPAGQSACCNWQNGGCTSSDGQFGTTRFAVYPSYYTPGFLTEIAITNWLAVATDLARLIDDARGLGKLVNMEFTEARIYYAMTQGQGGEVVVNDAQGLIDDFQRAESLPAIDAVIAFGSTFNGGVLEIYDNHVWGCWSGYCKGQGIDGEGRTGYPGSYQDCPANRICDGGCCDAGYVCDSAQGHRQCTPPPPPPPPPSGSCSNDQQCTGGDTCVSGTCCASMSVCGGMCCPGLCKRNQCMGDKFASHSVRLQVASNLLDHELRTHGRRVARLHRIQDLADQARDMEAFSRAEALMTKEIERHGRWLSIFTDSGSDSLESTAAPPVEQ